MEAQGSAAELIRVRIGELVAKGDFHAAMVQSEELEILASISEDKIPSERIFSI